MTHINDLIEHYKRKRGDRAHFFSPGAMSFFDSKVEEKVTESLDEPGLYLFITSEKGPSNVRRWTVRSYDSTTGNIDTIGLGFQGYKTLQSASLARWEISK